MPKKPKKLDTNKPSQETIKNAVHLVNAFGFTPETSMKMINSGLLGYHVKKGEIVKEEGKAKPLTISRATFYNYQKKYTELPVYYKELRKFAMEGYTKLISGFQTELSYLHAMAGEIMLSTKEPMDKLHAISILVKDVIPAQSAFADLLRDMLEENPKWMEKSQEEPDEQHSKS